MKLGLAVVALGMSVSACGIRVQQGAAVAETELTSAQIHRERAALAEHLDEADHDVAALTSTESRDQQLMLMHRLVVIFSVYFADAPTTDEASTTMRAYIDDLSKIRDSDIPNRDAFVLRAYQLIAYARAHVVAAE
jgi:hypothetical protein